MTSNTGRDPGHGIGSRLQAKALMGSVGFVCSLGLPPSLLKPLPAGETLVKVISRLVVKNGILGRTTCRFVEDRVDCLLPPLFYLHPLPLVLECLVTKQLIWASVRPTLAFHFVCVARTVVTFELSSLFHISFSFPSPSFGTRACAPGLRLLRISRLFRAELGLCLLVSWSVASESRGREMC